MSERRLLFVHNYPMRFVQVDLALLRERYEVTELRVRDRRVQPAALLKQVQDHDLIFAWFASWHSFLPLLYARLLGKPSVLVIGGYDVANMPEIGYGNQRGGAKKWVSRATIALATRLFTNAHYSREEAARNIGLDPSRVEVIYHGLDTERFALGEDREPMAITVGNVNRNNLGRKGLEPFVRAAQYLPEIPFIMIGKWHDDAVDYLRSIATHNVSLTGFVSDEVLRDYLMRAKVYVQASAHEGFGLSVAEAMLCGCVPVVTQAGALPEVVGDTGIYVSSQAPEVVASGIRQALGRGAAQGEHARQHIVEHFPINNRRQQLFSIIDRTLEQR